MLLFTLYHVYRLLEQLAIMCGLMSLHLGTADSIDNIYYYWLRMGLNVIITHGITYCYSGHIVQSLLFTILQYLFYINHGNHSWFHLSEQYLLLWQMSIDFLSYKFGFSDGLIPIFNLRHDWYLLAYTAHHLVKSLFFTNVQPLLSLGSTCIIVYVVYMIYIPHKESEDYYEGSVVVVRQWQVEHAEKIVSILDILPSEYALLVIEYFNKRIPSSVYKRAILRIAKRMLDTKRTSTRDDSVHNVEMVQLVDSKESNNPLIKDYFDEFYRGTFGTNDETIYPILAQRIGKDKEMVILISEDASQEAQRLAAQGTLIEPTLVTGNIIQCSACIDGSIILDPLGTCYAIGVILDGELHDDGPIPNDNTRGSRHNTLINYVNGQYKKGSKCMIVSRTSDDKIQFLSSKYIQGH
jgi:hypothetical protein